MEQESSTNYDIDHEKVGKRGYPMHYQAYQASPPMKIIDKRKDNSNLEPNK